MKGQNDKNLTYSPLAETSCHIVSPEYCQVLKAKFGKMRPSDFKKCEDMLNTIQNAKAETSKKYLIQVFEGLDMFPSQGKLNKVNRNASAGTNSDQQMPVRSIDSSLNIYGDIDSCAELSRLRGGSETILTPTQRREAYLKKHKKTSQ